MHHAPRPAAGGIDHLLHHPGIWRAGDASAPPGNTFPSGFPALDGMLPGGGWPRGAVTEIRTADEGIGELGLLVPVLAQLTGTGRRVVWIAPPHVPHAPALADRGVDVSRLLLVRGVETRDSLWAAEQALRTPACGAVLLWEGAGRFSVRILRRLQLAAKAGGGFGVVFRRPQAGASPAALRLGLEPQPPGLAVTLLKCRGGMPGRRVVLGDAVWNEDRCGASCGLSRDL